MGTYYIVGDFNGWSFVTPFDKVSENKYEVEVFVKQAYAMASQVIHNMDWRQAFYPDYDDASCVQGPAPSLPGMTFDFADVRPKSTYKVTFTRHPFGEASTEASISWKRLEER